MRRTRVLIGTFVVLLFLAPAARAASISVESTTVTEGDFFNVAVVGTDILDLFTFGFDLAYDDNLLAPQSVTQGSFFDVTPDTFFFPPPDFATAGIIGPIGGTIVNQGVACQDCELAIIRFEALATGVALLTFQNIAFFNSGEPGENTIDITANSGRVDILQSTSVPEPATLALFGLGLLALARRIR